MGYRSMVQVALYTLNNEHIPMPVLKLWFDENYPHKDATEHWGAEVEHGDDYILVLYNDVKWYEDFAHPDEVKAALDRFIETFEEEEAPEPGEQTIRVRHPVAWEFARTGEDTNDIETDCSDQAEHRMGITRLIEFN